MRLSDREKQELQALIAREVKRVTKDWQTPFKSREWTLLNATSRVIQNLPERNDGLDPFKVFLSICIASAFIILGAGLYGALMKWVF